MLRVPKLFEANVAVNLKEVCLIFVVLLNLMSCPISILGIFVRNDFHGNFSLLLILCNLDSIFDVLQVFLIPLLAQIDLVEDKYSKLFGPLGLVDHRPDSVLKLRVSVRCDAHE